MNKLFKVIKVIDETTIVINAGEEDGITKSSEFLIFELGEELFDPETEEKLGRLEVVKGTGEPIHIQNKLTTVRSNIFSHPFEKRRIIKKSGAILFISPHEEVIETGDKKIEPFKQVHIGDLVKII